MHNVSSKNRTKLQIGWFELGASALFGTIGFLLLGRALWHTFVHHELMIRSIIGGLLFCALGVLFGGQGLKPDSSGHRKIRGKISKRHRAIKLWVLLLLLASVTSVEAQATLAARRDDSVPEEHSSGCEAVPVDRKKVEAWIARAKRSAERARSSAVLSAGRERKLGERLAREIEKNTQFSSDLEMQEYLAGVVQKLAIEAQAGLPVTTKIVKTDEVNVFSLPGGFLYVTTGLIRSTESEAQLAALLGHEIAHILARHGSQQRKKQAMVKWFSIPLLFAGPAGSLVRQIAGATMPLKFSRDAEREADVIGIELLGQAGYDATDYVIWLESSVACSSSVPSKFERIFDSYPAFQERLALIEFQISELPTRSELVISTSDFDEMRAKLAAQATRGFRPETKKVLLKRRNQ